MEVVVSMKLQLVAKFFQFEMLFENRFIFVTEDSNRNLSHNAQLRYHYLSSFLIQYILAVVTLWFFKDPFPKNETL